jgi:nitroreductase
MDKEYLKNILNTSQRCQRNWDLSKTIPKEDIDIMIHAIKSSPSKQNERHFKVSVITDYDQRYQIYNDTDNFAHGEDGINIEKFPNGEINYKRQSQLMGHLLFVFSRAKNDLFRGGESYAGGDNVVKDYSDIGIAGKSEFDTPEKLEYMRKKYDSHGLHAIGISVGYLLLTAHILGYKTGCSGGFDPPIVKKITREEKPEVVVAVGIEDSNRTRTEEHFEKGRFFPTYDKDIEIDWIS